MLKVKVEDEWIDDVQGVKKAVRDQFEACYKEEEIRRPRLDGF